METTSRDVLVIGAGIAGLSAAYFIAKAGLSVTVLEASERVGGRMTTDKVDGFLIDRGAQFLSTEYFLLLSLAADLGLESYVRETSSWSGILRNGKICRTRADNPMHALTSGLLQLPAWARLGWRSWQLRNALSSLPLNDYSQWAEFDSESVSTWANRALHESVLEYVLEPMLHGFYFQEPESTSAALSMALLGFGYRRGKTLTLAGGIGMLPDALASRLDIVKNSPVTRIESGTEAVTVTTNGSTLKAKHVVLATPANEANNLYQAVDDVTRRLMATRYSQTINIAVMTDETFDLPDVVTDVYGVLIPRCERRSIVAIGIENNKNRNSFPKGQLLNIMLSNARACALMDMTDDVIAKSAIEEAESLFPLLSAHVVATRVYRWKAAEPYSNVGRAKDLRHYREAFHPLTQRVILTGDYMSMPFTEGAAESGRWAASQITGAI